MCSDQDTLQKLAELQRQIWDAARRYERETRQIYDGLRELGIPERLLYKLPPQFSGPGRETASMLLTAMLCPEMRPLLGYAREIEIGEQQRWELLRVIGNEDDFDDTGSNCVQKMHEFLRPVLGGEAGHKAMLAQCARFLFTCLNLEEASYEDEARYVDFKLCGLWQARSYGQRLYSQCERLVDALWVIQHPEEGQSPPEEVLKPRKLEPGERHRLLGGALELHCFKSGIRVRLSKQLAAAMREFLGSHLVTEAAS